MTKKEQNSTASCQWCGEAVEPSAKTCSACFMPLSITPDSESPTAGNSQEGESGKPAKKPRKASSAKPVAAKPISMAELDIKLRAVRSLKRRVALGVDPGARYTAFSVRDDRGELYMSSTYYRDDDTEGHIWASQCADHVQELLTIIEVDVLALESVVDPTGFHSGRKASLNPRDIMRTALVVGAIYDRYRDTVVMVRPRGNGSQDPESYPSTLHGRRPADLPGFRDTRATTRNHERSAYDVAGKGLELTRK